MDVRPDTVRPRFACKLVHTGDVRPEFLIRISDLASGAKGKFHSFDRAVHIQRREAPSF